MGWRGWLAKLSRWVKFPGSPPAPRRSLAKELAAVRADRDEWQAKAERAEARTERLAAANEELRVDIRRLQADITVNELEIEGLSKIIVARHALVDLLMSEATWLATQPSDRPKGLGHGISGDFGG